MNTPFWKADPNSLINRARKLITTYFGEHPSFDIGLVVAKLFKNYNEFITQTDEKERQVWLHKEIFKILRKKELPANESEALDSLELRLLSLEANRKVDETQAKYDEIERRSAKVLVGS